MVYQKIVDMFEIFFCPVCDENSDFFNSKWIFVKPCNLMSL